jgi:hypothetical protein
VRVGDLDLNLGSKLTPLLLPHPVGDADEDDLPQSWIESAIS